MASLAPLCSINKSGVFIAGLEAEGGQSTIQFYYENGDNWCPINDRNDDQFSYDNNGGFPAFRYFKKENNHFLLIAGGINS